MCYIIYNSILLIYKDFFFTFNYIYSYILNNSKKIKVLKKPLISLGLF